MISEHDCLSLLAKGVDADVPHGSVADFMTPEVVTIDADSDIVSAAKKFLVGPYRLFPVLKDGRLAGMISRHDILKALSEHW